MKPNVLRILTRRLNQLLVPWRQQRSRPDGTVVPEHERERSPGDYEIYYWGFAPAPWY